MYIVILKSDDEMSVGVANRKKEKKKKKKKKNSNSPTKQKRETDRVMIQNLETTYTRICRVPKLLTDAKKY